MKTYIVLALLVCSVFTLTDVQEVEAELPTEFQVETTESALQYYYDFLKGVFLDKSSLAYPPVYRQCDKRWGSDYMGDKTICQVGCLMSSMSMALAGLGRTINGETVNPGNFNQWLRENDGYNGNLFRWSRMHAGFNLKYLGKKEGGDHDVDKDHLTIINVHDGSHWVYVVSKSGSTYEVVDSAFPTSTYESSEVVRAATLQIL
ncbi:unnamed protein product [Moneuplotes crassus]|uniref:Peptidase C39-like domain-containing protein n=1 Tax=Euplotes crassus TaxID=5936 RepID=A0AAD1XYH5_EUPCR|nr:unnamed protein product [Moneuplotes crassus]